MHRSYVKAMCARALSAGAKRLSLTQVHWDVSGSCTDPRSFELEGREDPVGSRVVKNAESGRYQLAYTLNGKWAAKPPKPGRLLPLVLTMDVKCRACPTCLRFRSREWRRRAETEINAAPRTWFGTLTLHPEEQSRARMRAIQRVSKGGSNFAELTYTHQFREVHSQICTELTRWLKRVRKESGAKLRYCLVAERHKSGEPHYHILVHEVNGGGSVKERTLRQQWTLGHSKFNLVHDKRAAAYVSKYLSKDVLARVRASKSYGKSDLMS